MIIRYLIKRTLYPQHSCIKFIKKRFKFVKYKENNHEYYLLNKLIIIVKKRNKSILNEMYLLYVTKEKIMFKLQLITKTNITKKYKAKKSFLFFSH